MQHGLNFTDLRRYCKGFLLQRSKLDTITQKSSACHNRVMHAYYADHFVLPLPDGHRFPMEKYCSDIQMALAYGIPKEKLVAGVPFYGVTKDGSKKTEAYFSFVQDGLITGPAQNEVTYKGDVYVFDGQNNIRAKTRYAMDQQLKGMMSWDLATDMPLNDSRSLFKTMVEELGR